MRFDLPTIDHFSFWLGFFLSALLWWVGIMLRPVINQMIENIHHKQTKKTKKGRSISAFEDRYLQAVILHAQGLHLAAPLFALDEILVRPRLLAPPPRIMPGSHIWHEDIVEAAIPFLPAWPELAAIYHAPTLSLRDALSGDSDIVLTGQPGTGKTVALADLASQVARKDSGSGLFQDLIPFFFHIADLDLPAREDDPLSSMIDLIAEKAPVKGLPRITEFIRESFSQGRALLLLDGTDELTPEGLIPVIDFIKFIKRAFPKTRVVTTASIEYMDGLLSLNFIPLTIASWTERQSLEFITKWSDLWIKHISVEVGAQAGNEIDSRLLSGWLAAGFTHLTPFELTLKTWGAFAGDLRGPRPVDALETHIRRMTPSNLSPHALVILATQVCRSCDPVFDPHKALKWVRSSVPVKYPTSPEMDEWSPVQDRGKKPKQGNFQTTQSGFILGLLNSGLLSLHRNNHIRFTHPIFLGYLAGKGLGNVDPGVILEQPQWIGKYLSMEYLAAMGDASQLAEKLLSELDRPLSRNLFVVARWLREASHHAPWRASALRKMVEIFLQEGQPLGFRGQAVAVLIQQTGDPSITALFRQMLESQSADLLQLTAIGAGAIKDINAVELLTRLVSHPNMNVRRAVFLALVVIGSEAAMDVVADALLHGDENQRHIAAEALSNNTGEGYAMLQEGAGLKEDLMVRHASVYGLRRIQEPWAVALLQKLQVEDDQWVVRNAANEAIEDSRQSDPRIPKRLPPPTESPWIISFAGKLGLGVSPGKPPIDLLLAALKSPSFEERIASLYYLRIMPSDGVFGALYQAMYSGDRELREAVFYTLTEMAARGVPVPDPVQFGLGSA